MKHLKSTILSLSLLATVAFIVYPALAHCGKCAADGKKMVALMDKDKITLAKSIEAAEKHSKGRAVTVISELSDAGKLEHEVYCIVGDKIQKCRVNAADGAITNMKEATEFPVTQGSDHGHAHGEAMMIKDQKAEAGCGMCIYKIDGVKSCKLAVKIDGKAYMVTGADHIDAHTLCDAAKKAVVSGKIENDKFAATKFEVLK